MPNKERIYEDAFKMSGSMGRDALDYVWPLIQQEIKQQAIAFAKYILLMDIEYDFGEEMWWNNKNTNWLTDEQLYELFLQSQKQ